jgi:hypothetical protein
VINISDVEPGSTVEVIAADNAFCGLRCEFLGPIQPSMCWCRVPRGSHYATVTFYKHELRLVRRKQDEGGDSDVPMRLPPGFVPSVRSL